MMSVVDWHGQDWLRQELKAVRLLALAAGRHAYRGPGFTRDEITEEAQQFLHQSLLLSSHQRNPQVVKLTISLFRRGWRDREREQEES